MQGGETTSESMTGMMTDGKKNKKSIKMMNREKKQDTQKKSPIDQISNTVSMSKKVENFQ